MATAGLVNPFMPYTLHGRRLTSAVFNELLGRLQAAGALSAEEMVFDDEGMKVVFDRMIQDHGVDLPLHSLFVGVEMDARRIVSVQTVGKSGRIDLAGIGEAAGIAAAWVAREGIAPREVDGTRLKAVVLGDAL